MSGSLSADSNGTGAACTTFYLLHFAMQHDRHPVMQASTTRHIVRARNADSKMRSDACTWHRHDFTKSLWQPAAWTNPSVPMAGSWDMINGPLGHKSRAYCRRPCRKQRSDYESGIFLQTYLPLVSLGRPGEIIIFFWFILHSCVDVYFTGFFFLFFSILSTPVTLILSTAAAYVPAIVTLLLFMTCHLQWAMIPILRIS